MQSYSSNRLREAFLAFFRDRGHAVIPSASIIPDNDPSVLFTMAGMHPLVPYLMGQPHPGGTRLADVQKCIRTGDIDEVGDASHLTFFEMLGNWSLGDYFKREAIAWSWEFLTSKSYLGIDPERLAFSVFAGDENAPRDQEAHDLWLKAGAKKEQIFFLPAENNWWKPGPTGPCGPDTEMFFITDKPPCGPDCSPACDCGRYLEIWNDVFMQYNRLENGELVPLAKKNVDTGMGLERTICTLNGQKSVYDTDAFSAIIAKIETLSDVKYGADDESTRAIRIIADHTRTSTMILGDEKGITPSNVDQGYVLRRLIRRAVRMGMKIGLPENSLRQIAEVIIAQYEGVYPELERAKAQVLEQFELEEQRFQRTLRQGLREFEKAVQRLSGSTQIDAATAFRLYDTYGFPIEITTELAKERNLGIDEAGFAERFRQHQQLSKAGAEQRFKGGLADSSEQTARLHTATHLLHAALRKVLSEEVAQRGSNITTERLRFDFSFPRKVAKEELDEVERLVNEAIAADYPIAEEEMTVDEAKAQGAIGLFESKYGERVRVYTMGPVSKEICGGPHAGHTGELVAFKIQKEEASSAGVRRIRAVIEAE
ncbi:MAG: alanine--tRNA ligase [Christensenellaceae bacterium]|jgi:alanyl-tRNA synthetase|nr:alanine--tRNA ligase [Christensenellaceae bacterium]